MSFDNLPSPLTAQLAEMVREMIAEIRPRLIEAALSGNRGETDNLRHADNFLSSHDLWMHQRYRERLTEHLDSFVYASEEADPVVIGTDPDPDLVILVDPLDTSELAVRGLHGYTHVMAYSRTLARPVAVVVGDIFHHIQLYIAGRDPDGSDHAFAITTDGHIKPLSVAEPVPLNQALITNYLMRPTERFRPLAAQDRLLDELGSATDDGKVRGRIGVDFGSVGLCHVAAGFTDAMVEFAKGFAIWDLAPGQYVLSAAGGIVTALDGRPLLPDAGFSTLEEISYAMKRRQKFVAASGEELAAAVLATLG